MREQKSGTVAFVGSMVRTFSSNNLNSLLTNCRAAGVLYLIRLLMRLVNLRWRVSLFCRRR
jgi:hypothetical protein